MTYNLSALENLTGIGDLMSVANSYTNNTMFLLFLIALFVIIVMVLKRYDFAYGLVVGGWITFVLSALLAYGGLLNPFYVLFFLAIGAFGSFYLWARGN